MNHAHYVELTDELRGLIAEHLSVQARTFPAAVRKAGRLLPSAARVAARDLIAMEQRISHPKLAARTDPLQADRAAQIIRNALSRRRPGAHAQRRRSLLLAEIGFRALIVIGAGLILVRMQSPI